MGKYRIETEDGHSYEVETQDPIGVQMGGQGAPNIHGPSLPSGLQDQKENFFNAPGFGVEQIGHGIEHMAQPGLKPKLEGAHQAIGGVEKSAMPFVAPALAANPIGLGIGIAGGYVAGKGIRGGLELAGAPPEVKDIGEDAGNLLGGGATFLRPKLGPAVGAGVRAAAPDVALGGTMIGASEALAHYVPGAGMPARIGLAYPGSHMIARGMYKGFGAAKARYNQPDVIPPSDGPPGSMTAEQVTKLLPSASPQAAAAKDTHPSGTTQAQEFQPPVVKGPAAPASGNATPGPVQPPVAGPQTPPAQPFSPVPSSAQPTVQGAPAPAETPGNGTVEMPKNTSIPKGGQEFPGGPATESAVDVMKPRTQPPNELPLAQKESGKPLPSNDVSRPKGLTPAEWDELKEKYLKANPDEPQFARTESGRVKLGADVASLGNILGSSLYSKGASGVITKELMQNAYDAIRGVKGGEVKAKVSEPGKWIEISDNGKGMTADDLATVFTDLGASGKRNEAGASGGFGLAKAAPLMMSDKLELRTVSRDPASGKLMEHIFNTSKADLLEEGSEVQSREVPEGTPTGTTIRSYLGKNFDQYEARNFISNANRSVKAPGKVSGSTIYGKRNEHDTEKEAPMYEDELSSAKHLMQTEVPGSKLDIYASPPKSLQPGEFPTPAGSLDVEVNNHGIYQFSYPIYLGNDEKVTGLPARIAIDVQSTVPEGDPNYPFSANRETLREDVKQQVKDILEEKFIKPGKKAYLDFLSQKYNSLPELTKGIPLYDSGNRLTLKEKYDLMKNQDFVRVAQRIEEVAKEAIKRIQASGHPGMDEMGESIEKVGIVFAPEIHGVFVPKPGSLRKSSTIFINPLSFKPNSSPYQIASLIWHTIKHEILHDKIAGHYEEFTSGEAGISHAIGEYELSAIEGLKGVYYEPGTNTLRKGIDQALQLYEESRTREALERDIFGGENLSPGGSKPGPGRQAKTGAGLPAGGERTVSPPDSKSLSTNAPGVVRPPKRQ